MVLGSNFRIHHHRALKDGLLVVTRDENDLAKIESAMRSVTELALLSRAPDEGQKKRFVLYDVEAEDAQDLLNELVQRNDLASVKNVSINTKNLAFFDVNSTDAAKIEKEGRLFIGCKSLKTRPARATPTVCYNCGQIGHNAKNCTSQKNEHCLKCGSKSHDKFQCTSSHKYCLRCKNTDHSTLEPNRCPRRPEFREVNPKTRNPPSNQKETTSDTKQFDVAHSRISNLSNRMDDRIEAVESKIVSMESLIKMQFLKIVEKIDTLQATSTPVPRGRQRLSSDEERVQSKNRDKKSRKRHKTGKSAKQYRMDTSASVSAQSKGAPKGSRK